MSQLNILDLPSISGMREAKVCKQLQWMSDRDHMGLLNGPRNLVLKAAMIPQGKDFVAQYVHAYKVTIQWWCD